MTEFIDVKFKMLKPMSEVCSDLSQNQSFKESLAKLKEKGNSSDDKKSDVLNVFIIRGCKEVLRLEQERIDEETKAEQKEAEKNKPKDSNYDF